MPAYSPLQQSQDMSHKPEQASSPERASSSENSDEYDHFLPHKVDTQWSTKGSRIRRHWRWIAINVVLVTANLLIFAGSVTHMYKVQDPQHASTPLFGRLTFEEREFNRQAVYLADGSLNYNKPTLNFNGPPRPALEEAWGFLKNNDSIRVSEEELGQFAGDDTIIRLTDGSGFYSTVAVYHALHCVQRLHHYLYQEHYYPDLDDEEQFTLLLHTEHCLDWLREYVTCNADTTLIPVHWQANHPDPTALDWGKHQCVAWGGVEEWMASHAFDPYTPGLLMHPVYGSPYNTTPGATHHNLGAVPVGKGGLQLLAGHGEHN